MENLTLQGKHYALIRELPASKQGAVYKAIFDYAMENKEPTQLTGMSKAIFENIRPYIDNVEKMYINGKKGGRPVNKKELLLSGGEETKPQSKDISKIDKFALTKTKTKEQTKMESKDESKPQSKEKTFIDKDNISLSNKINNLSMRVRACESDNALIDLFKELYKHYFDYWGYDKEDKDVFEEIMVVLANAIKKAKKGELKFYQIKYSLDMLIESIAYLDEQDIRDIVWQVMNNNEIKNRELYITGALLSRASEKKTGNR